MGLWSSLFGGTKPEATKLGIHTISDGAIRVFEVPIGKDWQVQEDCRQGDDFTVRVLKYILLGAPMPLALLAKVYATQAPARAPSDTDWNGIFDPLFEPSPDIRLADVEQRTLKSKLDAVEASIVGAARDFPADDGGHLCIRERRSAIANEEFIVTAMGPRALFEAHRNDVDRWFDLTFFVPVDESD